MNHLLFHLEPDGVAINRVGRTDPAICADKYNVHVCADGGSESLQLKNVGHVFPFFCSLSCSAQSYAKRFPELRSDLR